MIYEALTTEGYVYEVPVELYDRLHPGCKRCVYQEQTVKGEFCATDNPPHGTGRFVFNPDQPRYAEPGT